MALNALTLSVNSGTRGKPFRAAISGLTDGSKVDPVVNYTHGFEVSNGFVTHPALPYDVNTLVLREELAGQDTVETKLVIPAYSVDNPEQAALSDTQAIIEDDVGLTVPVAGIYTDTITPTVVDGEVTGFILS
jgi:hypothetical protein